MNTPCCKPSCGSPATVEIQTVRLGGQIAGPDPYLDTTYGCDAHVGDLLGHQPNAIDTHELYWEVRSLEQGNF